MSSLTLPDDSSKIDIEMLSRIEFPEMLLSDLKLPELRRFAIFSAI